MAGRHRKPDDHYVLKPEGEPIGCGDLMIADLILPWRKALQKSLGWKYGHVCLFLDKDYALATSANGPVIKSVDFEFMGRPNVHVLSPENGAYPDEARVREFSELVQRDNHGEWNYLFLLGINFGSRPSSPEEIRGPYTCVTLCGAALYYGGLDVRALNSGLAIPGKAIGAGIWKL